MKLDSAIHRMRPGVILADHGLAFAQACGRHFARIDTEIGEFLHNRIGAPHAEFFIIFIRADAIGVAFDDDGDVVLILLALGGQVDLAFAKIGQLS